MSEEFDFSELRNYLMGQMDLGETELYLDEPWALTRKPQLAGRPAVPGRNPPPIPPTAPAAPAAYANTGPASIPANPAPRPAMSASRPAPAAANPPPLQMSSDPAPSMFGSVAAGQNIPSPRPVKRSVSPFESADSLQAFYDCVKSEALYAKEAEIVRYMGPEHPKMLFLMPAVKQGAAPYEFFSTPVGEMLVRLFANLNMAQQDIGVTYFFKSSERPLSPLLETALKKMLTKELSFIQPQIMVTFGQPLFHQLFGKAKNFEELAGADMDFAGVKTCSLIDPYAMVNDKQMKWLTWKIHIPRSTLFK